MLKNLVNKSNWEFIKEVAAETHEKTKTRVNFIVGFAIAFFIISFSTGIPMMELLYSIGEAYGELWNDFKYYVTELFL